MQRPNGVPEVPVMLQNDGHEASTIDYSGHFSEFQSSESAHSACGLLLLFFSAHPQWIWTEQ
jgi:hypothetical protein